MPYRWIDTAEPKTLTLTPHQSMTPHGFVVFMGATLAMITVPLLAVLGSPVLWGLLPFFALAIWGLWYAIDRNRRDAQLTETLTLTPERIELIREEPRGQVRQWAANPYWVSVHLHPGDAPVEHYLTLKGGGREVELGAFLSPEERVHLHQRLTDLIGELRNRPAPSS